MAEKQRFQIFWTEMKRVSLARDKGKKVTLMTRGVEAFVTGKREAFALVEGETRCILFEGTANEAIKQTEIIKKRFLVKSISFRCIDNQKKEAGV